VTWLTDVGLDWGGQIKIAPLGEKLPEGYTDGLLYPLNIALGKWRLPYLEINKYKTDPNGFSTYYPYVFGYSEVGHLFQLTLGNFSSCEAIRPCEFKDADLLNVGPFLLNSFVFMTGMVLSPIENHAGTQTYPVFETPWGAVLGCGYCAPSGPVWPVFDGDIKNYPAMNPYLPPGVPEPDSMFLACLAILVAFAKARPVQGFLGARSV
jgi:hypothetical protein